MKNRTIQSYIDALSQKGLLLSSACDSISESPVLALTADSRRATEGTLFVCKGAHFLPEYLLSAKEKGAIAYVSEKDYGQTLPLILVSDVRAAMVVLALIFFEEPALALKKAAITATKGKSTVSYYIKSILDLYLEKECAILSSIDNYDGVIREESHLTTPEPIDLQEHFANARGAGLSHLVMEVSSQALKYGRVEGVRFEVGVFGNIGTDHISPIEHPDFEDYFASKLKIASYCDTLCINRDIPEFERVCEQAKKCGCKIVLYGESEQAELRAVNIKKNEGSISFRVITPEYERDMDITMPGLFNVSNALAAIAVCRELGVDADSIARGLHSARVSGRMEVFESRDRRISVIVDYAHNKMSFEALFASVDREFPGKKKIAVFGCPGKKAFLRRTDLGEIAGRDCDYVIVTEEDSGEEPFDSIAADIAKELQKQGCPHSVCEDRELAVREAILEHGTDKVILLTGKGRETRMKRGLAYIDTPSDVDYTEKYLALYDSADALVLN